MKKNPSLSNSPVRKPDEFKTIPRADLFPDPNQPRKTFDEVLLKELAASIKEQGIVQPLIVRFVPAKWKIMEPDLSSKDYQLMEQLADGSWQWRDSCDEKNIKGCRASGWPEHFGRPAGIDLKTMFRDCYVIIAGERRWRASELAGVNELPCLVRDLDAQKVFAQQFIENKQRENVSAIEEAKAIAKQLEARRAVEPQYKVEALAGELGMSRAALYGRIVLTRLHKPVEDALLAGTISTSVAGVVALVPLPKDQERMLKQITNESDWKFPYSVREVQELVEEAYVKQLDKAPFKLDKTYPAELTGPLLCVTCTECVFRSGNMAGEFPELAKRPNVCTRPDCFTAKVKAAALEKVESAAAKGLPTLTAKEYRKRKGEFVEGGKIVQNAQFWDDWNAAMGKHKPEPVLVATDDGVMKVYPKEEASKAAKKNGVRFNAPEKKLTPEEKIKAAETAREDKARADRRQIFMAANLPKLAAGLEKLKDAEAWKLLAKSLSSSPWRKTFTFLSKRVKSDRAKVLVEALENQIDDVVRSSPEEAEKLWKSLGFDFKTEFDKAEASAQQTLALPEKDKVEPGKLLDVKPNKKKGKK